MTNLVIQASFNSGEWSPNLFARVDIAKYRSGAALLNNFYVDYRGGASTRPGSKYILQAYKSNSIVRVIPFQASFNVGYALEFGQNYIRFYYQGSPILESTYNISAITRADPAVVTLTASPGWSIGDWIFITGAGGMSQIDGRYFSILNISSGTVTLGDLNGNNLDSTAYTAYTSGGTAARVYTLAVEYNAADLPTLKYTQATNEMILVHPNYPPALLTPTAPDNWSLTTITFGSTATHPTALNVDTTLGAGSTNYAYVATSFDASGQESATGATANLLNVEDIRSVAGTNDITWNPVANAVGYNVYASSVSYFGVVPQGVNFGYIGSTTGTEFIDSNISPDFSQGPPVIQDPFNGAGVDYVAVTAQGLYTSVPTAITSGGTPTQTATLSVTLGLQALPTITSGGTGYVVGDTINFGTGVVMRVATIGGSGAVASWAVVGFGYLSAGSTPSNPLAQIATSGAGSGATATCTWGVGSVVVLSAGFGYVSTPTIVFSSGSATATATLGATAAGNPAVASFFQQRLVLAAPNGAPQTFFMSQPGSYFNFNISDPSKASDAITETLVSGVQQTIKSMVSSTSGMLVLTDKGSWLINGGSSGSAVSPTTIVANLQSSVGASDLHPIVANYSVLYGSSKGSSIRELAYNIYFNVFTGTDISTIASHLFYGYTVIDWAWAEAPFFVVWAVRNDGVMLTLTFLKEQEFVGWTHQTTQGLYKSVCAVTEVTTYAGIVDAIYTVAQRVVNGNTVQYIERIADRVFPNGLSSAWCVDAGIQYSGSGALSFSGAEHLAGMTVTGLATDNLGNVTVIPLFTMPVSGLFALAAPGGGATNYTTVTIGLGFSCYLQTLPIDVGQAPIQGKLKKIPDVTVRVKDTLGLSIGSSFSTVLPMKDLVQGNVSSMLTGQPSQIVSGLYTGDARAYLDSTYTVPGQYAILQPYPYPATVLGVFPNLVLGDTD